MKTVKTGKKIPVELLVAYSGIRKMPTISLHHIVMNQLPRAIMVHCAANRQKVKNGKFFKNYVRKVAVIYYRTLEQGFIGMHSDFSLHGCSTAVFHKDGIRKDPESAYVYRKY